MSSEVEVTGGTTESSHACNHEDDGRTPYATVTVDGTRIPIINDGLRTEIRTDGAMGLTRHSEVYFPAEWEGKRYDIYVRALDPDEANVYDPVDIRVKDYVTDELRTVHRGFVMGVGGGSHGDIEMRMTVGDPGQLLGGIPFDANYGDDSTIFDVVSDVLDAFRDAVVPHVFERVEFDVTHLTDEVYDEYDGDGDGFINPLKVASLSVIASANAAKSWLFSSQKTFQSHTDSAADALDWVEGRLKGHFYFAPIEGTQSGIKLVYDEEYGGTLVAEHADVGDTGFENAVTQSRTNGILIYRNNALSEIRPVNQAIVKGKPSDGKVPVATAVHEGLMKRAAVPQVITEEDDSVDTLAGAEERARKLLQKEIEQTSLGVIKSAPAPLARPHTTIVSQPACGNEINRETPPFRYDVVSVVHNLVASDDDDRRKHMTEMRVGPHIERSGDDEIDDSIVIKESQMLEVTEQSKSRWDRALEVADDVTDISFPTLP